MLFSYKGINKDYKYKRGLVEASNQVEAMNKIKETEDVIVIISMSKSSNNKIISNVRTSFNTRLEKFENKINQRTNEIIKKDKLKPKEKRGIETQEKEKENEKEDGLAERSPILRGINKLLTTNISGPKKMQKKIVMDEDMYDNLQSMFSSQGANSENQVDYNAEYAASTQSELSGNKLRKAEKKTKKEKSEGKKIDWSLIETNDSQEVSQNMKIKVKEKEIIMFTRRLHIMLSSGVPLLSSLLSLKETSSPELTVVLADVTESLQLGNSFSESISKFPRQFDSTYVALVSIGETSGSLQKSLKDIIRVKEQSQKVSRKVKVASVYPIVISIVLVVFLVGANMFFIPKFREQFAEQGNDLPKFTEIVFGISSYFPWILGAAVIIMIVITTLNKKVPEFHYLLKRNIDKIKLKLPVIKGVTNASYMYSFSSNIALMLGNGIRLSDTLTLTGRTINNIYLKNEIEDVSNLMVHGFTFSDALREQSNFDEILINIAMTGEQSGKMVFSLEQVAEYFEQELSRQIDSLLELVQPLSIMLIGITIAPIIIAAYLPILDMSSGAGMF